MSWRLAHILFGHDYVQMENSADSIIRQLKFTTEGRPYVRYFRQHFIFLDEPHGWDVRPITFFPDKFPVKFYGMKKW